MGDSATSLRTRFFPAEINMAIVNVWPLTTTPLRSTLLRDVLMKAAAVDKGLGLIKSYISVSYINRSDNPLLGRVVGYIEQSLWL